MWASKQNIRYFWHLTQAVLGFMSAVLVRSSGCVYIALSHYTIWPSSRQRKKNSQTNGSYDCLEFEFSPQHMVHCNRDHRSFFITNPTYSSQLRNSQFPLAFISLAINWRDHVFHIFELVHFSSGPNKTEQLLIHLRTKQNNFSESLQK